MGNGTNTPKRMPWELIATLGRLASIVATYFLGRRRRKRYGDNWWYLN